MHAKKEKILTYLTFNNILRMNIQADFSYRVAVLLLKVNLPKHDSGNDAKTSSLKGQKIFIHLFYSSLV